VVSGQTTTQGSSEKRSLCTMSAGRGSPESPAMAMVTKSPR
jgi:hypothetical protein